jgi:hypothetical protein
MLLIVFFQESQQQLSMYVIFSLVIVIQIKTIKCNFLFYRISNSQKKMSDCIKKKN